MRHCRRIVLSCAVLLLFVMCGTDHAPAMPPWVSPEQMRERAQVIVTGKVDTFRTRDEERHPSAEGQARGWPKEKERIVLLQVTVDGIEKGSDAIRPGDVITIRCWRLIRRAWYPPDEGWIDDHVFCFIPSQGGSARFFLSGKNDEGWHPVCPGQAVVRLDNTPGLEFTMEPVETPRKTEPVETPGKPAHADTGAYAVAFGVGGAVVCFLAVWFAVGRSRRRRLQETRLGRQEPLEDKSGLESSGAKPAALADRPPE